MRVDALPFLVVLLLAPALAGCIVSFGDDDAPTPRLEVFEYRYTGDDVFVAGHPYGFLARIHNPTNQTFEVRVFGLGAVDRWGPVLANRGWVTDTPDYRWPLQANGSRLFLFQASDLAGTAEQVGFEVRGQAASSEGVAGTLHASMRNLALVSDATPVAPGDHVQTATLGVWANGTSFYTNIADLNANEAFPAGYDRDAFDGAPLPVYVYGEDRSEQPDGSIDTCHFTTIPGYNELLKTQAEGSTNVRFLRPEEAYTRPGAEGHELYGDALVFLNTVVAHDGSTDQGDAVPEPRGACFDPARYLARYVPIDLPPLAP